MMKVYSHPGKGTTFKVLFPASKTQETVAPKAAPVHALPATNELILVIDDEDIIRRTAKSMLEHYGYTVVLAENGKEGVELFQVLAEKVSAVLLDMAMPVMNGEETLRHLKAINPAIKVILSSGYNEVDTIRRFTGKGLAGFIQKPYSSAALVEKVRSVLQNPNL
jgi:CheY-like chemotaxis protein